MTWESWVDGNITAPYIDSAIVNPPPCCKHCWRVVPRCSCFCSNYLFFSGSPSGKPRFSFRKPLPTGHSKISKCLKCAPVQAGTLPRGAKVAETHAIVLPPGNLSPPGDPQNHHFSVPLSPKAQGPLWAPWLDPWRATWSPHGAPRVPNGLQNHPKWTPKRVPKGLQNAKHRI